MREGAPARAGRVPPATGEAGSTGETTDEDLMTAYAGGDVAAFETLYARHKGPLYRYFRRQLGEPEAHDCFQTLWLKIIHYQDRYSPEAPFRHYLYTLAHNVLMDHHRKEMRRPADDPVAPDELPGTGETPEDELERSVLRAHLHRLVKALPAHQREAWLLRQETDFSTTDIARITGSSEEGVKSRLRYARDKLKQGMARYAR